MNNDASGRDRPTLRFWGSRASIGLIVLAAVAAYFLFSPARTPRFLPALRRPAPAGHLTCAFEGMAKRPPRKFA